MIAFIVLISVVSLVANMVGTISGFGLGTIMMPTLLFFIPFHEAILLSSIVHWFHDVWKISFFWRRIDWKLLLYFGFPTIIATFVGASLVMPKFSMLLSSLLGLFIIISVCIINFFPRTVIPYSWLSGFIGGVLSGFFAGLLGVRGAIRSVFLTAFELHKATYLGTIGAISILLDSTRLLTYLTRGIRLPIVPLWALVLFIVASFIGAYLGYLIVNLIPQERFRTVVSLFLILMGIRLLLLPFV